MESLSNKIFQNRFTQHFPGDTSGNLMPRQTPGVLWSKALPTAVKKPELLAWSDDLAHRLGIERPKEPGEIGILSGNLLTESMRPYAACYAGHQFGNWAGQLGDGRAITLGEWESPDARSWELQLKGAGPTPYSRRADGRAVLRSSVREYLMSEAMHYLGVPTTRALSLVRTGEDVIRDMFYDGNAAPEPGAIVMRVAPSFLRFGNFEVLNWRKETEQLQRLVQWSIDHYYPTAAGPDQVLEFFKQVVDKTATMIVHWMRVGFVHGVMNTDNMSILGLTIDYGPYSFVDDFDLNFTPNTTDLPGRRYAFGRQPAIAQWNLGCLAGALVPLVGDSKELVRILEQYADVYWMKYYLMMCGKIGFDGPRETDIDFFHDWETMMDLVKPDMTIFYQLLAQIPQEATAEQIMRHFQESFYNDPDTDTSRHFIEIMQRYLERRRTNECKESAWRDRMMAHNPRFVLRNYLLHQAIEGLNQGDDTVFRQLEQAMKDPYGHTGDRFWGKRPEWAKQQAGCSMLSCSS